VGRKKAETKEEDKVRWRPDTETREREGEKGRHRDKEMEGDRGKSLHWKRDPTQRGGRQPLYEAATVQAASTMKRDYNAN